MRLELASGGSSCIINRAAAHYICICISLHCPLSVVVAANNRRSIDAPKERLPSHKQSSAPRESYDPPFLPFAKNASSTMGASPVPTVCYKQVPVVGAVDRSQRPTFP